MNTTNDKCKALDGKVNRLFVDLIFDLSAGERFRADCTYEEQLGFFISKILPDYNDIEDFIAYGQNFRLSSKYMFPGKPDKIKNRGVLIKLFSNFVVLKELNDCNDINIASDQSLMLENVTSKFSFTDGNDLSTFTKEVTFLTQRYADFLNDIIYKQFTDAMKKVEKEFEITYSLLANYVVDDSVTGKVGSFADVLAVYQIPQEAAIKFHLEVDAIAEIVAIKNEHLEYEEEFKSEWEKHFPKLKYTEEVEKYIKSKKAAFVLAYGNNISSIRNEAFLFFMLADVTVKLALADGAKNVYELAQKVKGLTSELGNTIRDTFIDSRKHAVRIYGLGGKEDYPADLTDIMIPYRSDLMYLRDIIIEEISFRKDGNIVQQQSKLSKDASEYELLISQKNAEIHDLKNELEYYENIKQQEFKMEVSQYNKALTDLFIRICDNKYNAPLNELYLLATGLKAFSQENIRGILQNLLFILSTMNIVPYETGTVGKKVKFYDDEANIIYSVNDSEVKEGLNQGTQVYPGWKYKDAVLVLPKVDMKKEG